MKKHTTKLTKIMAILLVVGIALTVVGFVLKATNEMLVFIGYAGILVAVVSGVLIYKESGKTTTTRPGEIELPLGSTKNGHSGEVRISVLFSDVEDFKANKEEDLYTFTLKSGGEVIFRMTTYSDKTRDSIIAIINDRIAK